MGDDWDSKLHTLGSPCFYLSVLGVEDFANRGLRLALDNSRMVVRFIRGKKCTTVQAMFDEFGAALQFPYYFGENWPAFDECINDLEWVPGDSYALFIEDAPLLLSGAEDEDWRIFVRTLTEANTQWVTPNQFNPRNWPPIPFHVVLQCATQQDMASVSHRLTDAQGVSELLA